MSLEAVQDRIKEIELHHKVEGGTHFEGVLCPTCEVIKKLQGLKKQYLNEKLQKAFKNDSSHTEELSG